MNELLARHIKGEHLSADELNTLYGDMDEGEVTKVDDLVSWKVKTIWNIVRLGDRLNSEAIVRVGYWLAKKL